MSGNILNFNAKKIQLRLSDSEYHDFYLAQDEECRPQTGIYGEDSDCLVVHYDFNDSNIYSTGSTSANTIYSLATWSGATNTGYTLDTIGLTGIDNGLITFDKQQNDYTNDALFSALTDSTLVIPAGENRFFMHQVSGMTNDFVYPMEQGFDPTVGTYMNFCGGFYQGFYKIDGTDYEVLPNRVSKEWTAEFWLNKSDEVCSGITGTTLNDVYPENKGIFFYLGTRAENKFWNQFEGLNTGVTSGCTSGSTEWCTPVKEFDVSVIDDASGVSVPLNPPQIVITEITNQFLIYGRARSGTTFCNNGPLDGLGNRTACNFTGDSIFITSTKQMQTDDRNPFLIFSRTKGKSCGPCGTNISGSTLDVGITACNYSGDSVDITELDWAADVVDNAIGFMIKDDGSIGYRLLTFTGTCSGDTYISGCSIEESFSPSGTVKENEWTHISIRFIADTTYDECELEYKDPRKGKLMFYVDCRLKHVVDDFDEFVARRLDEHWKKQVGVPFNISLGGGSQGLIDSMTFDGQDPSDQELCIEENFAGSFIGAISQFRFNICGLNWCELKANCAEECERYGTCTGCIAR
jgi:hypothetical protein